MALQPTPCIWRSCAPPSFLLPPPADGLADTCSILAASAHALPCSAPSTFSPSAARLSLSHNPHTRTQPRCDIHFSIRRVTCNLFTSLYICAHMPMQPNRNLSRPPFPSLLSACRLLPIHADSSRLRALSLTSQRNICLDAFSPTRSGRLPYACIHLYAENNGRGVATFTHLRATGFQGQEAESSAIYIQQRNARTRR
jgi:hypothetical protein